MNRNTSKIPNTYPPYSYYADLYDKNLERRIEVERSRENTNKKKNTKKNAENQ